MAGGETAGEAAILGSDGAGIAAKVALGFGYAVFAVLLNSVGAVISQSVDYWHVTKVQASTLEAFKDLTIAVVSFLLAAQLPRFGFRRSMIAALILAGAGCLLMPFADAFWAARAMFFCVGFGFALMKVSVYSVIGLVTRGASAHARLLGLIEAAFMAAVLASAWIFAAFIDPADKASPSWLNVYWLLAGLCGAAAALVFFNRFGEGRAFDDVGEAAHDEPAATSAKAPGDAFADMIALIGRMAIIVFIAAVFLYVFIEQGLGTWLPTINKQVLGLDPQIAVQVGSVFAASIALGRFVAGLMVTRIGWFRLLLTCLFGMAAILLVAPGMAGAAGGRTISSWGQLPLVAWLLPVVGIFMAPIYPTLNSVVLNTVPKARQPGLIGLIVVFSALGGTAGSRMVAELFSAIPDARVLYSLLVPIAMLTGATIWLRRLATD